MRNPNSDPILRHLITDSGFHAKTDKSECDACVILEGLRYDDLYDPYFDLDIKEALARLPREVVDARHQRVKRALDLSMKHKYLPDDLQVRPFLS